MAEGKKPEDNLNRSVFSILSYFSNGIASSSTRKPVRITLTGDDAHRSTPPEPTVKILKRPVKTVQHNCDSKVFQPKKTLQQREQEYAEARLRILGEASSEKNEER